MRFNKMFHLKLLFLFIFVLTNMTGYAQTAAADKMVTSANNQLEILMVIIAVVLAFVIWGMGQILIALGMQLVEKTKPMQKIISVLLLVGLSVFSVQTQAEDVEKITVVANYGGMDSIAFQMLSTVIFIEMILIAFMLFFIRRMQAELLPQKVEVKSFVFKTWWAKLDKRLFTKAVSVEKEKDILLDHDYDGIKELDNALPPWWKYGFMITIVVAIMYLLNFHVWGYGKNPTEEYQEEIVKAQEEKEIYDAQNKDKINEEHLLMPGADGLAAAKDIFTTVCWTCHGKLGEGGAGPNLTDAYWLHKGSLTDVYYSIKHGYPDKGMQAWEKTYSPKEINNLAGYIRTLKGNTPENPKAPQGDLFVETSPMDSAATVPATPTATPAESSIHTLNK